jgi:hypothetical protein
LFGRPRADRTQKHHDAGTSRDGHSGTHGRRGANQKQQVSFSFLPFCDFWVRKNIDLKHVSWCNQSRSLHWPRDRDQDTKVANQGEITLKTCALSMIYYFFFYEETKIQRADFKIEILKGQIYLNNCFSKFDF